MGVPEGVPRGDSGGCGTDFRSAGLRAIPVPATRACFRNVRRFISLPQISLKQNLQGYPYRDAYWEPSAACCRIWVWNSAMLSTIFWAGSVRSMTKL